MVIPEILDALDVGVIFHHPETGEVVDVNDRMTDMYGYSAEQFRSMAVEDFSAAGSNYSQAVAERRIRKAADGNTQTFEWHARRTTGELLWVRVGLSPVTVDGEEYVMAEIRDITDYKRRERRVRLLHRVLRHNLRNDMMVILGHADDLERAVEDDDLERQAEIIEQTAEDVAEFSDSVRQIEELTEREQTDRTRRRLDAIVGEAAAEIHDRYPSATVTVDADSGAWVHVDEGFRVALGHLIENAVEHSDRETPTVELTAEDEDGYAMVHVADDGPGIPQVEIDALDEPEETTDVDHGQGLGLWVAKWCVESLGGELLFRENNPRGSVVTVRLPTVEPPESTAERSRGPESVDED